ncbi:MAG: ATP-binding protein [Caldilinea sp.]
MRIDHEEIESLIADKRYFILHAPRQTGKTTCLLAMMQHLNTKGEYRALYANIEGAQAVRGNLAAGMGIILSVLASAASVYWQDAKAEALVTEVMRGSEPGDWLRRVLEAWSRHSDRPVVLLLDEVDALVGDTLISLLRQIRAGYAQRPAAFPQTVILCGVRDVKDYRIHTNQGEIITGGSAFNIKSESLRLGNFSRDETIALWQQHEAATGQHFDSAIWDELWMDTEGQPWLVNALAHECTWKDRAARDRSVPITLERYKAARERLIQSRATHLDQLTDKLQEERVRGVIADLLAGEDVERRYKTDDLQYVEDLGLIRVRPQVRISNRIYREVIPRELTWTTQAVITHDQAWYLTPERRLDMPKLLGAFQQFFREHSDAWIEGFSYKEAGPQLLMQAFLQRIVNGGGRISREYALGRKRTDLFLEWPLDEAQGFNGPVQRVVIELKLVLKGTPEAILPESLQQTADYADRVGADEAYLLIFDRRAGRSWDERCWQREEQCSGRRIAVWGM